MRKGYVALHSTRRKFGQVTRANNTAVDVTLRLEAPIGERLKAVKVREGDFQRGVTYRPFRTGYWAVSDPALL
jgi:hypothetical protein